VRLTVDHAALAPAINAVSHAVPARAVRPILTSFLLSAEDGQLTITATDMETAIISDVPATVHSDGRSCLPAKYLIDLVRRIPSGILEIEADNAQGGARISWGKSQFSIHGFSPEEFPATAPFPSVPHYSFPQRVLRAAISHTTFAAAQGETARALLTGVELRFAPDGLFALATDGFQAAVYASHPDSPRPESGAVVVPSGVLQDVSRLLADSEDLCDVAMEGRQILIRAGTTHLVARTLEGRFFAVLDLVPAAFPTRIRIAREALVGALERMAVIADAEPPHCVLVDVGSAALRLAATRADVGSAEEELAAGVDGTPIQLGFNVRQTLEGLRRFAGQDVLLEISGPKSLARWTDPEDRRFQHLQMPLEMAG
jgi:DNA polymerase-3 subunit beta